MISAQDFSQQILHDDAFNMLCGRLIGSGSTRNVYQCNLMPDHVVKVEQHSSSFANITEFKVWEAVMGTEHEKWFARVHSLSNNGRILIMEKTLRPGPKDWPDKLPVYLTDRKRDNYGISILKSAKTGKPSNYLVCHDYGLHTLLENGMSKRMTKANWWDL